MLIGTVGDEKTPVRAALDTPVVGVEPFRAVAVPGVVAAPGVLDGARRPDRGQFTGALQRGIDVGGAFVHGLGQRPVASVGEHGDTAVAVDSEPVELAAPQRVASYCQDLWIKIV